MARDSRHHMIRMQIKRKPTAWILAGAIVFNDWVIKPIWEGYVQSAAQKADLGSSVGRAHLMSYFHSFLSYLPSSFGLGFAVGALIFAYWDALYSLVRRYILHRPLLRPQEPEIRAWAGEIVATFSRDEPARLFIRAINWGDIPFKVGRLSGHIVLSHDDGKGKRIATPLPPPSMGNPEDWDRLIEPGYILTLDIVQTLPRAVTDLLPDMFFWSVRPRFDFDEFKIILEGQDGTQKQLKLCDSLRLTTGEWNVRSDQATKMFKTDEEATKFRETMLKAAMIGLKRN